MITVLTQRALKLAMMNIVKGRKRLLGEKLPRPNIYYFGYGANLDLERFKKYQMNVEPVGVARLDNHSLKFSLPCEYLGKGFASADPEPGKTVWGFLYKLDRASLMLLDIMEWAILNQYRRVEVVVSGPEQKQYASQTYQARYSRIGLQPSTAYKNAILRSAENHSFPSEYMAEIQTAPSKDKFELDPGFSLLAPNRRRPWEKHLRMLYLNHDRLREKICELLRF